MARCKVSASVVIRLNSSRTSTRRPPALRWMTGSRYPRVWLRSIVGCGKLVKRNSQLNHKISGSLCSRRLFVVVPVPNYNAHDRPDSCILREMRQEYRFLICALAIKLACGITCRTVHAQSENPASTTHYADGRAVSITKLKLEGVPNFGEVSPTLYRGGSPSPEGLRKLKEIGIAIDIDLRGENHREQDLAEKLGMQYTAIGGNCFAPSNTQFARFLAVIDNNPGKKVFVHCRLGDDRTGMAVAAFRMANQGWTPEAAMEEMHAYGFDKFHHVICLFLARYEANFPRTYASAPDFAAVRLLHPPRESLPAAATR